MKYKILIFCNFVIRQVTQFQVSCLQRKTLPPPPKSCGGISSAKILCGFISCPPSSSSPRRWCPRLFYCPQQQVRPLQHYHPASTKISISFSILGNAPSVIIPITGTSLSQCFVPISTKKKRTLGQTSAWFVILSIKSAWNRESGIVMFVTTRIILTSPLQYFVTT